MTSSDPRTAAKDTADRLGQTAEHARDAAKDATARAGEAANDFAARAGEVASDTFSRAKDHIKEAAERLPGSASDALDAGRRAYEQSSKTVGRHVAKQPIEALLLAGAIGYLVGWASNRS